jgi:hypothetical protein
MCLLQIFEVFLRSRFFPGERLVVERLLSKGPKLDSYIVGDHAEWLLCGYLVAIGRLARFSVPNPGYAGVAL